MNGGSLKSISPEAARQKFLTLAGNYLQWWLRLPIINLLWRRDFVRFAVSLNFLISQILDSLLALDCLERDRAESYSFKYLFSQVSTKPSNVVERLEELVTLHDLYACEKECRLLAKETLLLGCKRFGLDFAWFQRVRDPSRPPGFQLFPNPEPHLSLARELAVMYRSLHSVVAVGVSDSVAMGLADETSDIDLDVVCNCLPSEGTRYGMISGAADDIDDIRLRSASDEFFVRGFLIDVRYWLLPRWSELVESNLEEKRSYGDLEALAHLDSMSAIWDPDAVIVDHKRRLKEATELIRPKRISRAFGLLFQSMHELQDLSAESQLDFFIAFTNLVMDFFDVLSAMNDRWLLFPKWARHWVKDLEIYVPTFSFCSEVENMILAGMEQNQHDEINARMTKLFERFQSMVEHI